MHESPVTPADDNESPVTPEDDATEIAYANRIAIAAAGFQGIEASESLVVGGDASANRNERKHPRADSSSTESCHSRTDRRHGKSNRSRTSSSGSSARRRSRSCHRGRPGASDGSRSRKNITQRHSRSRSNHKQDHRPPSEGAITGTAAMLASTTAPIMVTGTGPLGAPPTALAGVATTNMATAPAAMPEMTTAAQLAMKISSQQREIELWQAVKVSNEDLSGEDTPPLETLEDVLLDQELSLAVRQGGIREADNTLALMPPPPAPELPPPPYVRIERLVLEALRQNDPRLPEEFPALVAAAYEDEVDSVHWLLEVKSDPNVRSISGSSALWYAVANNNLEATRMLIQARADPNHSKRNAKGVWRSILDMAVHHGSPDPITRELWAAGARHGVRLPARRYPVRLPGGVPPAQLALKDHGEQLPMLMAPEAPPAPLLPPPMPPPLEWREPMPPPEAAPPPPMPPQSEARQRTLAESTPDHHCSSDTANRASASLLRIAGASSSEALAPVQKANKVAKEEQRDDIPTAEDDEVDYGGTAEDEEPTTRPASQIIAPSTQTPEGRLQSPAGKVDQNRVESKQSNDGVLAPMRVGSALAARSAFRKAYARQLLPLCDEKPVLDFSAYYSTREDSPSPDPGHASASSKDAAKDVVKEEEEKKEEEVAPAEPKPKFYAGVEIGKDLRGTSKEMERARARIVKEVLAITNFKSADKNGAQGSKSAKAGASTVQTRGESKEPAAKRPAKRDLDPMNDPWGCALAADDEFDDVKDESDNRGTDGDVGAPHKVHQLAKKEEDEPRDPRVGARTLPWMRGLKAFTPKKEEPASALTTPVATKQEPASVLATQVHTKQEASVGNRVEAKKKPRQPPVRPDVVSKEEEHVAMIAAKTEGTTVGSTAKVEKGYAESKQRPRPPLQISERNPQAQSKKECAPKKMPRPPSQPPPPHVRALMSDAGPREALPSVMWQPAEESQITENAHVPSWDSWGDSFDESAPSSQSVFGAFPKSKPCEMMEVVPFNDGSTPSSATGFVPEGNADLQTVAPGQVVPHVLQFNQAQHSPMFEQQSQCSSGGGPLGEPSVLLQGQSQATPTGPPTGQSFEYAVPSAPAAHFLHPLVNNGGDAAAGGIASLRPGEAAPPFSCNSGLIDQPFGMAASPPLPSQGLPSGTGHPVPLQGQTSGMGASPCPSQSSNVGAPPPFHSQGQSWDMSAQHAVSPAALASSQHVVSPAALAAMTKAPAMAPLPPLPPPPPLPPCQVVSVHELKPALLPMQPPPPINLTGASDVRASRDSSAIGPMTSSASALPAPDVDLTGNSALEQLPVILDEPCESLPLPEDPRRFNDSRLNEVQTRLIKELAGGSARHDPARDQLASRDQAKNSSLIDVRKLKFCHVTISPTFMNGPHRGLPVLSLLEDLHAGKARAEELPPLVVMKTREGLEVICGNRRLYCLKRYASEASKSVNSWCILYDLKAQETPRNLVMKYILAKTTEDGGSIRLRNS